MKSGAMRKLGATLFFIFGAFIATAFWRFDLFIWFLNTIYNSGETSAVIFAAIFGGLIAFWGIISQRAIARRVSTIEYIARQESDKDLIDAKNEFIEICRDRTQLLELAQIEKESSKKVQKIKLVLNDFELISIGIQNGVIDYEIYKMWHRSGVIHYWGCAKPFVEALRARTNNQLLYHEFESLVGWFEDNSKPKRGYWMGQWIK